MQLWYMHRCMCICQQRPLIHHLTLIFYRVVSIGLHPNANSYLARVCQINAYVNSRECVSLCTITCYSESFLYFSFIFCTCIKSCLFSSLLNALYTSPPHALFSLFLSCSMVVATVSKQMESTAQFQLLFQCPQRVRALSLAPPTPLISNELQEPHFSTKHRNEHVLLLAVYIVVLTFLTLYLFSVHA